MITSLRGGHAADAVLSDQITDDTGVIANQLHGFRGRLWGAGPTGLYVARLDNAAGVGRSLLQLFSIGAGLPGHKVRTVELSRFMFTGLVSVGHIVGHYGKT